MSTASFIEVELPPFFPPGEARLMLAVKLYETGRLTLGQGARAAGRSLQGFIDELGAQGVAVIAYPASDLAGESEW